jgi:hypothetical protein
MNKAYYVREYTASGLIKDATPYATPDDALNILFQRLKAGGVVKGWIEDEDGHPIMLPDDVRERFGKWMSSN